MRTVKHFSPPQGPKIFCSANKSQQPCRQHAKREFRSVISPSEPQISLGGRGKKKIRHHQKRTRGDRWGKFKPAKEKGRKNSLAKVGATEGDTYPREIVFNEFYFLVRGNSLVNWQRKWDEDEDGRWLHSIIPKVSLKPWFNRLDLSRDFIRIFSRLMSNHCSLDAVLYRFDIAGSNLCSCGQGYHDIEHIVWSCEVHLVARTNLIDSLRARGKPPNVPVRDVLAVLDLDYMLEIYLFLKAIDLRL
ncbi:uncharacterized protein LOC129737766 [Uranotaenia lowii]|uniref:uncharacterized protein LOC129737766 n=1 Tax=Uranotaenia lowii TaxID=190385 RepID=UPI00247B17D0|nr:uncharacterized protein LOC129737766 [Uranotaenia lowii]